MIREREEVERSDKGEGGGKEVERSDKGEGGGGEE